MKRAFLKKSFIISLSFVLSVFYLPRLSADENTSRMNDVIDMVSGDIQSVTVNNLTRVSVTNPEVADISDAQSNKVSLIAKKSGETVLFLWDAGGKHSVKVRVASEDLTGLKARLQKILEEANISGVSLEENPDIGKVVVSGNLSKENVNRLGDILQPYGDNLLNLVKVEKNEDLIQVDMQIVEISTSLDQNLGILWGTPTNTTNSTTGTSTTNTNINTGQASLNYNESIPGGNKFKDLFKIGHFKRGSPLEVTLNALVQEGKAKLISKPRLVVVSGKQASFLVGGEIPVISTTISTTGSTLTSNTTYAQYGVNLSVTPTIREGKIDVLLNVDIRDIDASNSSNGNTAFITRTATTQLLMDNKQTIAMAGLIKYTKSEQVSGIPFLSKIPIVGALFRNRSTPTPESNTEMVIILTPTVLTDKKFAQEQLVMPTPVERTANTEFYSKYEHEPLSPSVSPANMTLPVTDFSNNPAEVLPNNPPGALPHYLSQALPPMTAYARMVQERISKAVSYPIGGIALAGTVKLKLHILKNGSLDSEEVMESSGNDVLDQYALQAAKRAAPYDAFITGMDQEGIIFTIPIVYNRPISKG